MILFYAAWLLLKLLAGFSVCLSLLVGFVMSSQTFMDWLDDTPDRSAREFLSWLDDVGADKDHLGFTIEPSTLQGNRMAQLALLGGFLICLDAATAWIMRQNGYAFVDHPVSITILVAANVWFFWIPCCRLMRRRWQPGLSSSVVLPSRS